MFLNKIKKAVVALTAFMMLIPSVIAADYLAVQAYATDTVAGYPSALRTSLINPNQDVRFVVEKPDGAVVQIPAQADLEGVAKTDLYGHQTKIAGGYKVAVVYPGSATSSPQSSFTVYPDKISTTQSSLRSTLQMVEAGRDVTFVVATLYDQYKNPIADHRVKLISSRSEDSIETLQDGVTDKNGRATFKVTSKYPGISVFTAMDVTMNQLLTDREEIVF
ncbi:MAG: Ig-like domain-containing protein [Thermodesulfobacteriota bacterium]|nr:Ig-like domain-containing protein [Thermodesulfobacteriota bacterium]